MLSSHRDFKRKNKANLAVQGTMFAKINSESICLIQTKVNNAGSNEISNELKIEINNLIKVASDSSNCLLEKFLHCQSDINANTCYNYGKKQFTSMKASCIHNDNINLVPGVSDHIMTVPMINMVKDIVNYESQSGKIVIQFFSSF